MTEHKTVFDSNFRKEEMEFLTDDIIDKHVKEPKMLLHKYGTLIFDPKPEELSSVTAEDFKQFMGNTAKLRGASQIVARPFWKRFSRVLACAAAFAVICCLAVYFKLNNMPGEIPGNNGDNPLYAGNFRGNGGESVPTQTIEANPAGETTQEPLAYLLDANGTIEIKRGNSSTSPQNSCEVLYADDIVVLGEQAKAKIMYEDSFFDISGPSEYQIAKPSPRIITRGNNRQYLKPTFTTRGAGYGNPVKPMAIAPRTLIAQIAPPVTRAGDDAIAVYSPRGASYTAKPVIYIGGDENATYTVCILDLMGEPFGKTIQLKGNSSVPWSDISTEDLQPDEIYSLKVTLEGKIVNDANNSNFWLVSAEEAEKITDAIKRFDKIESPEARDFFKANALYMNGCYAEAREIASTLAQEKQNVQLYSNLTKLCSNGLGLKE